MIGGHIFLKGNMEILLDSFYFKIKEIKKKGSCNKGAMWQWNYSIFLIIVALK